VCECLTKQLGSRPAGSRANALVHVDLQHAVGLFVLLNGGAEELEQPLGGEVVHHDAVGQLDRFVGVRGQLGVQAEVEDQLFRHEGDAGEIRVRGRQVAGVRRVLHAGGLGLLGLGCFIGHLLLPKNDYPCNWRGLRTSVDEQPSNDGEYKCHIRY
jgi:hypothetical protein